MTNTNLGIIAGIVVVVLIIMGFMLWGRTSVAPTVDTDIVVATPTPLRTSPTTSPFATASPLTSASPLGSPTASLSPSTSPTGVTGTVKTFAVTATNFKFDPAEMRVKQGDRVRVTLSNPSTMPHDWKLDQFNAATKVINQGQTDTVEFVASQKGTFEYYCSVGQHRQQGMVGKLIVE